jgi:hypothetical protein
MDSICGENKQEMIHKSSFQIQIYGKNFLEHHENIHLKHYGNK